MQVNTRHDRSSLTGASFNSVISHECPYYIITPLPGDIMTLAQYTAIFHSSTGPGLAHVIADSDHSAAWVKVGATYQAQGRLVALIPGHHNAVLQGHMLKCKSTYKV